MDFEITPDQEELRASVRSVLEKECPLSVVREVVETGRVPAQPWASATRLGWPGIWVAEESGGLGLGFEELGLVIEEHGRFLAPGPMLATCTQFWPAVLEAGSDRQRSRCGAALSRGELTGALAVAGAATSGLQVDSSLRAKREGTGFVLEGVRGFVLDGDRASMIVVAAAVEEGDGCALFLLERGELEGSSGFSVEGMTSLDASRPLVTLRFAGVRVPAECVLGAPGQVEPALRRALDAACVALALETVGACDRLLELVIEHAKQRIQFDQPIGAFQAIQHKCVDMYIALEKARAASYFALMTVAANDPRRGLAASMAKVAAADCQSLIGQEAIQIHGGIGFTWESDVHLFVKRAKTNAALLGGAREHRARIADLLGIQSQQSEGTEL